MRRSSSNRSSRNKNDAETQRRRGYMYFSASLRLRVKVFVRMNPVFMREALDLARKGRALASPNPMVGAVVVRNDEVVGRGFHTYAGVRHAETIALAEAGERACGATVYINLEPCSHQGRTPPCAETLAAAGIVKVVAALEDPYPLVKGNGFSKLRQAGVEVELAAEFAVEAA